jgi:hypothetical protein
MISVVVKNFLVFLIACHELFALFIVQEICVPHCSLESMVNSSTFISLFVVTSVSSIFNEPSMLQFRWNMHCSVLLPFTFSPESLSHFTIFSSLLLLLQSFYPYCSPPHICHQQILLVFLCRRVVK